MRMSIKALAVFLVVFFAIPARAQEKKPGFNFKFDYPIVDDSAASIGQKPLHISFQDGVPFENNLFGYMDKYLGPPSVCCIAYVFITPDDPTVQAGVLRQGGKFERGDVFPLYGKRASSARESGFPIGLDFEKRVAGNVWVGVGYHKSRKLSLDVDEWMDFIRTDTAETTPVGQGYAVSYLTLSRRYSERKLRYEFTAQSLDLSAKVNLLEEGKRVGIFPHAGVETWFVRKSVSSDTNFYRYASFAPELFYRTQLSSFRALDHKEKLEASENVRLEEFPVGINLEVYLSKHVGVSFDTNFYLREGGDRVHFDNHESLWESFPTDIRLPRKVFYASGIVRF